MPDASVPPIREVGCIGNCSLGPSIIVLPEGIVYHKLTPEDSRRVVREHLVEGGQIVEDLLYRDPASEEIRRRREDMPFYREQSPLVLRNCGVVEPDIVEYMKYRGGYAALARALAEMTPEEVIDVIRKSGLRGRGAAPASLPALNGSSPGLLGLQTGRTNISSAMPTREIREHLWTGVF